MADPPASSEASAAEPGPAIGTDAWHDAQQIRRKMKETGAATAFATGEKIRNFTIEYSFNETITEDTPTINLYNLHRAFITELLARTEGDVHLLPTQKNTNPNASDQPPILSAAAFPESETLHRKFFGRQIIRIESTNRTKILIYHSVLMKETVASAKRKLFNHLKQNKLWMVGGELDSIETVSIGWFLGAHSTMTFRPQIERILNYRVALIPKDVVNKLIGIHGGETSDLDDLPYLYINMRPQNFGISPNRVSSNAVAVSCVKAKARLMKELIALVPIKDLPYRFIPAGLVNILSVDEYRKFLILNNDRQNDLQGITIQGFSKQLFNQANFIPTRPDVTVENLFLAETSIESIQETNMTPLHGRFIVIVHKSAFQAARKFIEEFCSKTFSMICPEGQSADDYRVSVGSLPHLIDTASAGGAVASLGALLGNLLKSEESSRGVISTKAGTWAQKTAPRLIFDKNADFPPLPTNANNTTPTGIITTVTSPSKTPHENTSVTSENTTSTFAPTFAPSGQTVISQDVSTVISEMRSIMTEQNKNFEKILERQDKLAKEAARENRNFMERMMDKLLVHRNDQPIESYKQRRSRMGVRASGMYTPERRIKRHQRAQSEIDNSQYANDAEYDEDDNDYPEEDDEEDIYGPDKTHTDDDAEYHQNSQDDMENDEEELSESKMSHTLENDVPNSTAAVIPSQIQILEKKASRKRSHISPAKATPTKTTETSRDPPTPPASITSSTKTSPARNRLTKPSPGTLKHYGICNTLKLADWAAVKKHNDKLARSRSHLTSIGKSNPQETKMQRTGTAPSPPTLAETFARKLDFESHSSETSPVKPPPDPAPNNDTQIE